MRGEAPPTQEVDVEQLITAEQVRMILSLTSQRGIAPPDAATLD
jgi:hypothetical protein